MSSPRIALLIPITVRPEHQELARRDAGPRRDYFELSRAVRGRIVDNARVGADPSPLVRGASRWLGSGPAYALWAYLHRAEYDLFYSDSERVGLPLAALLKQAGASNHHVMIGHRLTPWKKQTPLRVLKLHSHIDRIICHLSLQRDVARKAGVPEAKVTVVPYGIDHHFWRPVPVPAEDAICAVGMEMRDYPTLIEAVRGSGIKTVLAASSPWFDHDGLDQHDSLPAEVEVSKFDYPHLRLLYARCRFVVIPLLDVDSPAGITAILEAMAMEKAVVVTRTRGQGGYNVVRHGETGLLVPPGDPRAMQGAIGYLWKNPDEARRMGQAGRRLVEAEGSLDRFAARVGEIINATI